MRVKQRHVAYREAMHNVLPLRLEIDARLELCPAADVGMRMDIAGAHRLKANLTYLVYDQITAQHAVRHLRV